MYITRISKTELVPIYAKIKWGGGLFLYLIEQPYGGAGAATNGIGIEWVHPSLDIMDEDNLTKNYSWVSSRAWREISLVNNEEATFLLEKEEIL